MNLIAVISLNRTHAGTSPTEGPRPGNKVRSRTARRLRVGAIGVVLTLGVASCAQTPELPEGADAQLVQGRDVWQARCSTCHGPSGGGGTGPRLNEGRVLERFEDAADQVDVIANGKGNMPAFSSVLTEEEIDAVIRYTREGL